MKNLKLFNLLTLSTLVFSLAACNEVTTNTSSTSTTEETPNVDMAPINKEIKGCYNYFMATTNLKEGSLGYGLSLDRYGNKTSSSMAATGFNIASYPIYVKEGLMSKSKAEGILLKTFDTILRIQNDPNTSYGGCISHFVNFNNGSRLGNSEVSTIDTGILVSGVIVAGEYFKGQVQEKAKQIWSNVDYNKFLVTHNGKQHMSMGVDDPKTHSRQLGSWHGYAEHLMMYLIGAGNPNKAHRIPGQIYKNMDKSSKTYNGHEVIYSWFGSLFTYQFSHAFFNFNEYVDYEGTNYWNNSVEATLADYDWCQEYASAYPSFNENSWGLTACDTPTGYSGHMGAEPRGYGLNQKDWSIIGTISPCAAIGSMPFTPEKSYNALKYFQTIDVLNNDYYGLRDAFNKDFKGREWVAEDWIGIDKGISVVMLGNYKYNNLISNLGNQNEYIKEAFEINGFRKVGS